MGSVFPFFTNHMFRVLGYAWANSLFAFIALLMIPIPFVHFIFDFYLPRVTLLYPLRQCISTALVWGGGVNSLVWLWRDNDLRGRIFVLSDLSVCILCLYIELHE
jgi:hypothetical protein